MNSRLIELREVITKLVPMLAGRGLRVTQIGSKAYVRADTRTRKPVLVNIPMIPDNAEDSFIEAIQGFIDHEIGHVLVTDWNYYGGAPTAEELRDPKVQAFQNTHNILEDTMIEREIVRIFPGSESNIGRLRKHFIERITKPAVAKAKDEKEKFIYLIVPMMRALSGHKEFQEYMDAEGLWKQPFVEGLLNQLDENYIKRLRAASSTKETLELARELHDILYPPPPPKPPAAATGDMSAAISESDDEDDEGESEDKPEKEAGEGDGDGERDHSEQDDEGEEGPSESEGEAGGKDEDEESEAEAKDEDEDEEEDTKAPSEEDDEESSDDEGDAEDGDSAEDNEEDEESDDKDSEEGQDEDEGDEDAGSDGADSDEDDAEDGDTAEGSDTDDEDGDDEGQSGSGDEEDDDAEGAGGEPSDDTAEGGVEEDPDASVNENQDPDSATLEDVEPDHVNGGGVGTSSSKSMFDFTDDAFEAVDTSSAMQEIISKEIQGLLADKSQYIPLTRDLDEIAPLVPPENMDSKWVPKMDEEVAHMTGRMQKDIERIMASQSHVHYTPGHKVGKLHGPSLFRISQGDPRVFRQKEEHVSKDTAVTLLIDNSGSMHGSKMKLAMLSAYALSLTLDRVKITHEVLGFTTGHRGSVPQAVRDAIDYEFQSRKAYTVYDRTEPIVMPIYKDFDERLSPLVKKRIAYAMNAQNGLAGNIDGESVEYAAMRLIRRKEKRKVMLVLSDGQPAGGRLCQPHLRSVIDDCEKKYGIETIGIGIMDSSVKRFYPKNVVLQDVNDLPGQVMTEIKKLLI